MYRTDVYFLSKQIAEIPIYVFVPFMFVTIFYIFVGLNPAIDRYFMCLGIVMLLTQVVVGFGYMISCISKDVSMAMALGPPLIVPMMLFGGFFLNSA